MLTIVIPPREEWDEVNQEFVTTKGQTLKLEHSLVSLSKWEAEYCKPFLAQEERTVEETIFYVKCMTLTQNVDPDIYRFLTNDNILKINEYIAAPMTATTFTERPGANRGRSEIITSELIYYWMIALQIPFECQKWHLNRLLTLVKVCNIKNEPGKKMSRRSIMSQNAQLNAARRKKLNTKG